MRRRVISLLSAADLPKAQHLIGQLPLLAICAGSICAALLIL